jgi:hypothetical protein
MENHEVCQQLEDLQRQLGLIGLALDNLKGTIKSAQTMLPQFRAENPSLVRLDAAKNLIAGIGEECKRLDLPLVSAKTTCMHPHGLFSGEIKEPPDCGLQ